jgi:hypothetical protein
VAVDVVAAVRVEVSAAVPVIDTEVGLRLQDVALLLAPEGEEVMEQLRATVPVKELAGVTVMVEVPEEPGVTLRLLALALRAKLPVVGGACQKSPHPARSGAAASIQRAHVPIFIAAPRTLSSHCSGTRSQGIASASMPSCAGIDTR